MRSGPQSLANSPGTSASLPSKIASERETSPHLDLPAALYPHDVSRMAWLSHRIELPLTKIATPLGRVGAVHDPITHPEQRVRFTRD